jgi:hypothetical protein
MNNLKLFDHQSTKVSGILSINDDDFISNYNEGFEMTVERHVDDDR